ncbi:MAG: glycerate kinase [Methylococcales bacterium]|nr:glycerate kinase [Methylococcales bacterium]
MGCVTTLLKQHALQIFQAGVAAADPYQAVKHCLYLDALPNEKIHLIAFGKAACAMAQAAVELIPAHRLAGIGIAVTNYENVRAVDNVEVIGAGHPLPDTQGFQAAQKIAERVSQAQTNDLVLILISGGGSALLPYPVVGVTLEEKSATTDLLLACGANIQEINCVRKHLSQLKGGGLARLATPATVHALILSDVLGDDLSTIASGTTVADTSTYSEAIVVLQNKGVWTRIPESVQQHLEKGKQGLIAETPKPDDSVFNRTSYVLCASNTVSLKAAQKTAEQLGYNTQIYSEQLCGIAREEAEKLAIYASTLTSRNARASSPKPIALLAGGETTVNLKGNGKGGRNQEFALAFALAAEKHRLTGQWTLLSGGTDGRDGPTDAAGGIVNASSLQTMINAGINPQEYLNNNDAYNALNSSNDLLITGATGTNVADLQILLLHP